MQNLLSPSTIALDGNGRQTGSRTAQTAPYDRYHCHLCGSALQYHPEYQTERPWFEHRRDLLTEHCPYVKPEAKETRRIRQLQWYVPEACPLVYRSNWHCTGCDSDYHGERYCLTCRTGEYSQQYADLTGSTPGGGDMHILKCYLANDASGRFVTADNAARAPDGVWTCASCSCVLYLLTGFGEPPWFEHDKQTVAEHVLMNCVHQDPEVKAEARRRRLRRLIGGLEVPVVSLAWYCAWCGSHYQGVKYCANCLTGIYSIEEANWRMNYCGNTLPGINPVLTFCIR